MTRDEKVTVRLPVGFDPKNDRHVQAVEKAIRETYGDGFKLAETNMADQTAVAVRNGVSVDVLGEGNTYPLPQSMRVPGAGEKANQWVSERYPGMTMISFDPYAGLVQIGDLSPELLRARGAIATALGVKPWEVRIANRKGGGFTAELKSYLPSRHQRKLDEVATSVIGKPGWYVKVNPHTLIADFVPAELPTFEPSYSFPFNVKPAHTLHLPIGVGLGGRGKPNFPLSIDLENSAGTIIQGLAGAGKSVAVNALFYAAKSAGHWVAVVDVAHKVADVQWMAPFCHENWFGCGSKAEAVTVVRMVYEEGVKRGKLLAKYGAQKWQDLPADVRAKNPIIDLIMDEVSALMVADKVPKSLDPDHPLRIEAEQDVADTDLLQAFTAKIPQEMRAAGIRLHLATQQAQANTGIPPKVKLNLGNRVLLGAGATKQARGHAFANPDACPEVPDWIASDAHAARGSGVAELEGQSSCVFKSYFSTVEDYERQLRKLGASTTSSPAPTKAQVSHFCPQIVEMDEIGGGYADLEGFGEPDGRDAPDTKLRGAAKAAHELKNSATG